MHHAILINALNAAVNAGIVRTNVAKRASNKPRVRAGEDVLHNVWTADEAGKFLTAVKTSGTAQQAALFAVALDGGLRKSELLGLQWRDLEGSILRVERQVLRDVDDATRAATTGPVFSLPKGKRARSLDLSEETLSFLKTHKREQAELKLKNRPHYHDHGLIFAQSWEERASDRIGLGEPLRPAVIARQLDVFAEAAGVKRLTVQGLRHTCATLLLAAGVPPHVVQRRLGHKSIEITLNIYSHVLPSQQADAASRLASLLHG
jgi:integrase